MNINIFLKKEILDAEHRIRQFIKNNHRFPEYCLIKSKARITLKLTKDQYMGLFKSLYIFINKNQRYPNFVTLTSGNTSSQIQHYQSKSITCGPASLEMISTKLFDYVSEELFSLVCKTNQNGTSPDNLISGAKKKGFLVTKIPRNSYAVSKALQEAKGVLAHIDTIKAPCLHYINNYGHWITIKGLTENHYIINDPTKGENLKCIFSNLDNAMRNRVINYYSVELI